MRKSFFKRLVSAILAFSVIASVCACGGDSGGGKNKKKYDPNKTHLCLTSLEHIYANAKSKNLTQAI